MTKAVYERVVSEARAGDWAYRTTPVQQGAEPVEPVTPLV